MFLADYHNHTRLSPDSEADPLAMARAALDYGVSEMCFTDHVDLLDFNGQPTLFGGWGPYLKQFRALSVPGLTLRLGVELGEGWEDPELAARIVSQPELDFVIGSVHNLDSAHGGVDLFYLDLTTEEKCYDVLNLYMGCLELQAAQDTFDVLGHVIYPLRVMNGKAGHHIRLEPYFSRIAGVFRTLIAKDKGIEVNTCRGRTVEEWREILALYRDCGGRLVTLGSDAHRPQDMSKGIREGAGLLKEFGFDLAVYERRQPKLHKL